jgi:dsDNA-specific endonuclease/ATPase MutS2
LTNSSLRCSCIQALLVRVGFMKLRVKMALIKKVDNETKH